MMQQKRGNAQYQHRTPAQAGTAQPAIIHATQNVIHNSCNTKSYRKINNADNANAQRN